MAWASSRTLRLITTFGGSSGMSDKRNPATAALRAALIVFSGLVLSLTGTALPAAASDTGSISGTVSLPSGQSVGGGAEVCLFAEPSAGWSSQCVETNPYGGFTFTGLAAGNYSLSASADGYVTSYYGGTPYLKNRTIFAFTGGQLRGKDLRLLTGAMITGRVVDSAGHPFGYDLTLHLSGPAQDPKPGDDLLPGVQADGTKAYSFGPVPDGTYRVTAESTITCPPDKVDPCQWVDTTVVVSGGRSVTAPTLQLTGGTGFSGTVRFPDAVSPDQAPSRLYQLEVADASGAVIRTGVYEAATVQGTSLVGSYQLHLDPGRYQLRFTALDGTADACLGCTGGLATRTGQLLAVGEVSLGAPVKVLRAGSVRLEGTAAVGQRITAVLSGWPAGARLTHQWQRNGRTIKGVTSASVKLGTSDLKAKISVRVTASLGQLTPVHASATLAGRVGPGQLSGGSVRLSGKPAAGRRLTAVSTGWQPSGVRLTYRWLRDGKAIRHATGKSYRLQKADRGHGVSVRVTGFKSGYRSATLTSAASPVR